MVRRFFHAVHESGVRTLAADLRENTGGNSGVVDEFLRYLHLDRYGATAGSCATPRTRFSSEAGPGRRGSTATIRGRTPSPRWRTPPPFDGKCYLLTSNRTFSSGYWFAVIFRDNGLGELVGERPNPSLDPESCLRPEHPVPLTRADLVAGRDPVLEFVRARARDHAGAPR